ncbi:MAG: Holo-[acyl-carrier-protein] synthase [Phycisphaerales bacterium]|nr:Holo-[acyl-carrier-protein] synthase [Phycisphaerales bacterium]
MLAHGIDIVEVDRIRRMLDEHGESFRQRCFTAGEIAYCERGGRRDEHYAARFAAKEAVLKALGTGWSAGIAWTDVEVVLLPSGQPTVALRGKAAEIASVLGVKAWALSLSHTSGTAVASAIATGA